MLSLEELYREIGEIKKRNQKVEADKAWETSLTRKIIISAFTYATVVVFFYFAGLPKPALNAIVPAMAFVLSTLTVTLIKKWWLKKIKKV